MTNRKVLWILPKNVAFNIEFDLYTTQLLIEEISYEEDFEQYISTIEMLMFENGETKIKCIKFNSKIFDGLPINFNDSSWLNLAYFDICFLRVDPPITETFRHALILLSIAEETGKPWFINSPKGICNKGSKIFNLRFSQMMATTRIVSQLSDALELISTLPTHNWVAKPLDGCSGRDVVLLKPGLKSEITNLKRMFSKYGYLQLQVYIPEIRNGEERHIIFNNQVIASWLKIPNEKEFRTNLDQGATIEQLKESKNRSAIDFLISKIKTAEPGFVFYSIDIIGHFMNEINVENVGGLTSADKLYNKRHAPLIISHLRKRELKPSYQNE